MRIQIKRGEIFVTHDDVLESSISSCVSVCLYHPEYRIGGMTHIFGSRVHHSSGSGKFIRAETEGFYYADNAVPKLMSMMKELFPAINRRSLHAAVIGGFDNEGPIVETLDELGLKVIRAEGINSYTLTTRQDSRYKFKLKDHCINDGWLRKVSFDVKNRKISINRKKHDTGIHDVKIISL
jgi:chemotaxis receptor (MCP) glutamine deamidase CheD